MLQILRDLLRRVPQPAGPYSHTAYDDFHDVHFLTQDERDAATVTRVLDEQASADTWGELQAAAKRAEFERAARSVETDPVYKTLEHGPYDVNRGAW